MSRNTLSSKRHKCIQKIFPLKRVNVISIIQYFTNFIIRTLSIPIIKTRAHTNAITFSMMQFFRSRAALLTGMYPFKLGMQVRSFMKWPCSVVFGCSYLGINFRSEGFIGNGY